MVITPALDLLLRGSPDIPVGLYHLHIATARQLTTLHYRAGTLKTVQKRLKVLADNGFIQSDSVPTRRLKSPYFYVLGAKGIRYLKDIGMDVPEHMRAGNEMPTGYAFIDHALQLNDVLISALKLRTIMPQYQLVDFTHERTLKRTPYEVNWQGRSYSLVPDAFLDFHVSTAYGVKRLPLLLEVDCGTEQEYHFRRRIHTYLLFIQSQAYVRLFRTRALTIAFTTLKTQRLEQMRRWTQAEINERNLRSTFGSVFVFGVLAQPIEPRIWLTPCWYSLNADEPFALLAESV